MNWDQYAHNAACVFVQALPRYAIVRFLHSSMGAITSQPTQVLRNKVAVRFALDLPGLLNQCTRSELETIAVACKIDTRGSIAALRMRLWQQGAKLEAGCTDLMGTALQPCPIVLRSKLILQGAPTGLSPHAVTYPRKVPAAKNYEPPVEPDCLEQLLANADAVVGCRLGASARDKGAFGLQIAQMLGVPEYGYAEPDWQGEVEIKTVPVVFDQAGWWRVKEDPAISMETASPMAKLKRVLWLARITDTDESAVLSWYYQELGPRLESIAKRFLHTRPKGGKGTSQRGWYLHKRFFVESGFLRSLNGG